MIPPAQFEQLHWKAYQDALAIYQQRRDEKAHDVALACAARWQAVFGSNQAGWVQ